jgi:hypothetical protein
MFNLILLMGVFDPFQNRRYILFFYGNPGIVDNRPIESIAVGEGIARERYGKQWDETFFNISGKLSMTFL